MIITRTPLRISIAGGGTDLPSYYRSYGGALISSAIDKYIFVSINKTFRADYQVKYSKYEQAAEIDGIQHPVVREACGCTAWRRHSRSPAWPISRRGPASVRRAPLRSG